MGAVGQMQVELLSNVRKSEWFEKIMAAINVKCTLKISKVETLQFEMRMHLTQQVI